MEEGWIVEKGMKEVRFLRVIIKEIGLTEEEDLIEVQE